MENLVLNKWLPQNDLLNDERLTLFVKYGGMESTTEVAFSKVPAFGGQMRNVRLIKRLEIGLVFEKFVLRHSRKFSQKISEVLNNNKFKINPIKTAEMKRNKLISPEELLVKHFEFDYKF